MSSTTVKWSYSGLKQYLNCPKQYHEVKVLRNYDINVTEQMRYGTEVHSALEDYAAAQEYGRRYPNGRKSSGRFYLYRAVKDEATISKAAKVLDAGLTRFARTPAMTMPSAVRRSAN